MLFNWFSDQKCRPRVNHKNRATLNNGLVEVDLNNMHHSGF